MALFYIDFTQGSLGNNNVKYHGGGDFSRFITNRLSEKLDGSRFQSIAILWPKGVKLTDLSDAEREIRENYLSFDITDYRDMEFKKEDVLFLPLLDPFSVTIIGQIRRWYPDLKLYGVLHGLRLLDVSKYDKYDKYYYTGIKSNTLFLWTRRWMAAAIAKLNLKKNLPQADRIYTVSNYSMQKINYISKTKYLKFFYQARPQSCIITHNDNTNIKERFILFVNANRYEKNFIRALIAFCNYKITNSDEVKLFVLGSTDSLIKNIKRIKEVDDRIVSEYVTFFGYVSPEELRDLYHNSEFLLYTSKSEGYGLPLMEIMGSGRPAVASSETSVPEVLGMAAFYVNPYDVEDIKKGIEYMMKKENQERYINRLSYMSASLFQRGEADIQAFIEELLQ